MVIQKTGQEQRRAPRTPVDMEAELRLQGESVCYGILQDLSILGSLFIPERPLKVDSGQAGRLRFAVPTATSWIEPNIYVRRVTTIPRAIGEETQGIGFEFSGLDDEQERAISAGCMDWSGHRIREYHLSADCFVQGIGDFRHYARFGKVAHASRSRVAVHVPASGELKPGAELRLKVTSLFVPSVLEELKPGRSGVELVVKPSGWGRDFFLHEARRSSLPNLAAAARFPV